MKRYWVGFLILVLVLAGLGGGFFYQNKRSAYQILKPKRGSVEEAIYGLGTVKSNRVFEHKPGVVTALKRLYVSEGQTVVRGQRLIDLQEGIPLLAPFEGTVTRLPFHENENIFPQTVIVRIEDLKDRYVEMALEQQGALRIRPGQNVRLSFESLRGALFRGKVDSIYPSEGQFLVRINPEKLPDEILPGMTADAAVEVGRKDNVLLVPVAAVMNGKVTVHREGKRIKVASQLGSTDGEWVEVLDQSIYESDEVLVGRK